MGLPCWSSESPDRSNMTLKIHDLEDRKVLGRAPNEYSIENGGHTGLTAQDGHQLLDPEPVRPVCTIVAPPDLPIDAKRKMMQEITTAVADVYHISDLHNILIFLHEQPIENAANNGFLQTENPEFSVPGTAR